MKRKKKERIIKTAAISILAILAAVLLIAIIAFVLPFNVSADDTPLCEVHFRVVWHEQIVEYASVGITLEKYSDPDMTACLGCVSFSAYQSEMWERVVKVTPGYYVVSHIVPTNEWRVIIDGSGSGVFEAKEGVMYVYLGVAPPDRSFRLPEQWVVYGSDPPDFWIWSDSYFGEESSEPINAEESINWDEYMREMFGETSTTQGLQEESTEMSKSESESEEVSEPKSYSMVSETSEVVSSESESHLLRNFIILVIAIIAVIGVYVIVKHKQI